MAEVNMSAFLDGCTEDSSPDSTDYIYVRTLAGNRKRKITDQLNGINTLPINRRDGGDIGGYLMDGVDDYITIPAGNQANNIGLGDFSIEFFGKLKGDGSFHNIYSRTIGVPPYTQINLWLMDTNVLSFLTIVENLTNHNELRTTRTFTDDAVYHVVVVKSGVTSIIYINGIVEPSTYATNTYDGSAIDLNSYNTVFGGAGYYIKGQYYLLRLYNRALSATEIASIYNNGRPDLYSLVYSERNANNTSLTSGTLTIGKRYRLKDFIAGDDFTNVGAASNADGVEFIATGTTPTTWANSSKVIPIGCVAEYLPQNAGSLGWIESSGNQLSGSTSGSPVCLCKEVRPPHYRDIRKSIAADTNTTLTGIVPRGYKIVSIRAKGSDSLADIKIGSASAGEEIVAATTTSSTTPKLLTLAATANDAYSESADVTLYARHDTSASGKTMDLIFHFEKVGN